MSVSLMKICSVFIMLLVLSIYDIRSKKIPLLGLLCLVGVGFLFAIIEKQSYLDILMSCIPGILFIILAKLTKEKIGYGDGLCILGLGMALGIRNMELILLISLGVAAVLSIVLMIFMHKKKDFEIPFIPFLVIGFVFFSMMGVFY